MKKFICIFTIIGIFLYPITMMGTFQNLNVALWQSVLTSVLNQADSSIITEVKDINGDSTIDVRDLCLIVQKIKNEKTKIPTSRTLKNLVLYSSVLRTEKTLLPLKNLNNHSNLIEANFCHNKEENITKRYNVLSKNVKIKIFSKIPFLPLLC
ncbi:MAG TPA: hypothetical protein PLA12_11650 [Candidatus Hydrogenedens sp.]|nr:hypothetical protein [Candidatus Hydrogenedens sp.]